MSGSIEHLAESLPDRPWRPQSLQPPRAPWLALRWRLLILLGIVALHALGTRLFLHLLAANRSVVDNESVLLVDFIEARPPQPIALPEPAPAAIARPRPEPKPKRKPEPIPPPMAASAARPTRATANAAMQVQDAPATPATSAPRRPSDSALQLYNPDGSLRVPDDMLARIDDRVGEQRVFSYQVPHMDDAKKYFYRNRVLAYEPTRFDEYWKPDQDLLTDLLTRLVEKTTKQVKIPIPGHPGSTMVCTITLIALSGGCGVLTNGADYVGPVDDPDTLNPEEDRQCQAWWEQIVGARTQELWRKTRSLYEAQCRKPLLRPK
jgi:hypothetical protein